MNGDVNLWVVGSMLQDIVDANCNNGDYKSDCYCSTAQMRTMQNCEMGY
jgi:hypothetical protein